MTGSTAHQGSNQIWGGLCWRLRSEGEELLVVLHGQRRKRVGILLPTWRGFGHSLYCQRPGLCGECGTQGEKYWWCYKSPKFVTHNGKTPVRDADWDYCSPNPQNTRYNEPCSDACESLGETYYWCNTGSTWDYCSPAVETVEKVIGDGGGRCVGKCDALNEDYMWCPVINVKGEGLSTSSSKVWWDYC